MVHFEWKQIPLLNIFGIMSMISPKYKCISKTSMQTPKEPKQLLFTQRKKIIDGKEDLKFAVQRVQKNLDGE